MHGRAWMGHVCTDTGSPGTSGRQSDARGMQRGRRGLWVQRPQVGLGGLRIALCMEKPGSPAEGTPGGGGKGPRGRRGCGFEAAMWGYWEPAQKCGRAQRGQALMSLGVVKGRDRPSRVKKQYCCMGVPDEGGGPSRVRREDTGGRGGGVQCTGRSHSRQRAGWRCTAHRHQPRTPWSRRRTNDE